jgi:hypothetical protein
MAENRRMGKFLKRNQQFIVDCSFAIAGAAPFHNDK